MRKGITVAAMVFCIIVLTAALVSAFSFPLTWTHPTTWDNAAKDPLPAGALAGTHVSCSQTSGAYGTWQDVPYPTNTLSYIALGFGDWYCVARSYTTPPWGSLESKDSNWITRTIAPVAPTACTLQ